MKRIAIIGSVGIPAKYGGFETLVEFITKELSADFEITVYCSKKSYPDGLAEHNGAKLKYVNLKANGIQSIPYDIISMAKAVRNHDTILVLGVAGVRFIPFLKLFYKRKFIIHIDGCEWRRDKWNNLAKWHLKTSEKRAMKVADAIIADNEVIQSYTKTAYNRISELIEYGADHSSKQALTTNAHSATHDNYAFSVCRIEPENNVHVILEAFAETNYPILFVGNWDYSEYGKTLFETYSDHPTIHLLSPIYNQNQLDQLRSNCTIYLHGHSAGGTNPSLVEAMYLGRNILAFDVDYNRKTTENSAHYFESKEALKTLINDAALDEKGEQLEAIAKRRYTWKTIANKYKDLF